MSELSKANLWSATKLWPDSTVFIVGGGSSLNTTGLIWSKDTRDEILKKVSDSLSCIHDKRVIGVNNAFELGSWVDTLFFGDARWIDWNLNKVLEYSGLTICNVPINNGFVKRLERVGQHGIDIRPSYCCWNESSGGAAINLAVLLGAKIIVLVGYDMDVGGTTGEHNWHKIHKVENHRTNDLPYKIRFLPPMKAIKQRSDELGIRIINTSMNSKIEEFEKMELNEAVKLCSK